MTPQQIMDDRRRGWHAAASGAPFQPSQGTAWQAGWQLQREETLRQVASANDRTEINSLLTILRHTCTRLAVKGPLAIDLARAAAERVLTPAEEALPQTASDVLSMLAVTAAPLSPSGARTDSREGQPS